MFEEVQLIKITTEKNKNGEKIESETIVTVHATHQNIKRELRDKHRDRGGLSQVRFKIALFGDEYSDAIIPYFIYKNKRYAVTDFIKDKTGTHCFIEGETVKGKM